MELEAYKVALRAGCAFESAKGVFAGGKIGCGRCPGSAAAELRVPLAIAIVETASLGLPACSGVQVLRIDGKLPGEEGYRLK